MSRRPMMDPTAGRTLPDATPPVETPDDDSRDSVADEVAALEAARKARSAEFAAAAARHVPSGSPTSSPSSRGVREGSRRQTLDLPADDYEWIHDLARRLAADEGVRSRDLSAQHVLRAAVMLLRPDGAHGDQHAEFRYAVMEQATREAREVAAAEQSARDAARVAKDQARTVARTT